MTDIDRIMKALSADSSPLRLDGLELMIDHVLDTPVADLVDLSEAKAITIQALTAENLDRIIETHVLPGWQRYSKTAESTEATVGLLVPEASRQPIRDIVADTRLPHAKWAKGAVEPVLFRKLFAPVSTAVLIAFAKRLPLPGAAAATTTGAAVGREVVGSLAGRLKRSVQKRAEQVVETGRTVMGGLGAEMEKRLQATAKEFSESALEIWREALRDRLKSDDGKELLKQISRQVTDHLLMTRISEIHEDTSRFPVDDVIRTVPGIVSHASRQAFVQNIVDGEIAAFVEVEGRRPLRSLLEELGILDEVRGALLRRSDPVARELFGSDRFRGWLTRVLEADE